MNKSDRYDQAFDTVFGHVCFYVTDKNSVVYKELTDIYKVIKFNFNVCLLLFNSMFIGLLMFDFVCMGLIPFGITFFIQFIIMLALGYLFLFHNISISIIFFALITLIYLIIYLYCDHSTWLGSDISKFQLNFLIILAVFAIVHIIITFLLLYEIKNDGLEKEVAINKEKGVLKIINNKNRVISYHLKEFDTVILKKYGKKRHLSYSVSLNGSSSFDIFTTTCKGFLKYASAKDNFEYEEKLIMHCRKLSDFLSIGFTEKVI